MPENGEDQHSYFHQKIQIQITNTNHVYRTRILSRLMVFLNPFWPKGGGAKVISLEKGITLFTQLSYLVSLKKESPTIPKFHKRGPL